MDVRARRIVDRAIELAEKGGFEAVRLRDVASEADVALGTLYRHFRSKEALLIAALTAEVERLESRMQARPAQGDTALDRASVFFRAATKGLMRRPRLSRAILRAAASGDHELSDKIAGFHSRVTEIILAVMNGPVVEDGTDASGDNRAVAVLLQHVWFSCLIAWGGGLMSPDQVIEQMDEAATIAMQGASRLPRSFDSHGAAPASTL
ncbi:MAG: TetR/AcrR family transcriptional regulator [Deltaproteobacteria bacterium]|nr:TetR/AcrR family transcriptional regulator [Deltaproteobacteria bacterium]